MKSVPVLDFGHFRNAPNWPISPWRPGHSCCILSIERSDGISPPYVRVPNVAHCRHYPDPFKIQSLVPLMGPSFWKRREKKYRSGNAINYPHCTMRLSPCKGVNYWWQWCLHLGKKLFWCFFLAQIDLPVCQISTFPDTSNRFFANRYHIFCKYWVGIFF